MTTKMPKWFDLPRLLHNYRRRMPLVLVNGLAEQPETWFANKTHLSRQFDVKIPEILVYDGAALHDWIDSGGEVSVEYLADRLARFLDEFVQRPPYYLVASSLGSQVILNYATRCPEKVAKLVMICPSGFHGDESLPMIEGVRRSNYESLVKSVFHRDHFVSDGLAQALERKFQDRKWKKGVLRTLRATVGHSVAPSFGEGAPSDAGDLGCQRSCALGRPRRHPRGGTNTQGSSGCYSQMRSRASDRKAAAGKPLDLALPS